MRHDFHRASDPDVTRAEFVLQPSVHALAHGSHFVPLLLGWTEFRPRFGGKYFRQLRWLFGPATRVRRNDRDMVELLALRVDFTGVIGRVHQFVEMGDSLAGHRHQRNRNLGIVHARAAENGADRDLAVGDIKVELVATPMLLMALTAFLDADVALPRQIAQHRFQGLAALPLDARSPFRGFAAGETAFGSLGFLGLLFLRGGAFRKAFARGNGRGIARDMTDKALLLGGFDDGGMQLLGQFAGRNSAKARENFDS